jgi:hypothetical protein
LIGGMVAQRGIAALRGWYCGFWWLLGNFPAACGSAPYEVSLRAAPS